jgi:light-regulated signal transduction histidine kinase (bacteriophytochrome)
MTDEVHQELKEQLDQKIAELSRSNRELEQFAYVASHDLQEPLRMIANFVELLDTEYGDAIRNAPGDGGLYLDYVKGGAVRAKSLIDALLAFSRVGRGMRRRYFPAREAIDAAMLVLGPGLVERNARVHVLDPLPEIFADSEMMARLFTNVIGNSLKYRSPERLPEIEIEARDLEGSYMFLVRDNGVGFHQRDAERIFDLFRRLRTDKNGAGIGLAICQKIVLCHDGEIFALSEEDQGTTISFTISKGAP